MKKNSRIGTWLSVVLLLVMFGLPVKAQKYKSVFKDLTWEQAAELAQKEGKIVLVDAMMKARTPEDRKKRDEAERKLFSVPGIMDFCNRNIVAIHIDMGTEAGKAFAPKLVMNMYPTYGFFMPDGDILGVVSPFILAQKPEVFLEKGQKAVKEAEVKRSNKRSILFEEIGFKEALVKAKKEKKLIFIDAYTDYCQPCVMMVKNIFSLDKVADFYNENFINLKLDFGKEKELAQKYGTSGYPAFVFVNGDGKLVYLAGGYTEAEPFIGYGQEALKKAQGIEFTAGSWNEILAKAKELAGAKGEKVIAAVLAKEPDAAARTAIEAGADEAVIVKTEEKRPEVRAAMLAKLVEKYTPALVLAAATQEGKDVTPLAAQKFDAGCAVDVMNIVADGDQYVFTCPVYGGNVLNDVVLHTRPAVATVRGGSFSKSIEEGKAGKIIEETIEIAEETVFSKIANVVKEISEAVNLEDADVIVSGGRGMGSKENFALVQQLADVCGGVVGATRPAIEEEWIGRSHQVGQSGKIVAPKLYIACGVSGATQHVSGMIGSGYIIAINKDKFAPIFNVADLGIVDIADVGIVGDAMKILPLMIEEIKKYKEA